MKAQKVKAWGPGTSTGTRESHDRIKMKAPPGWGGRKKSRGPSPRENHWRQNLPRRRRSILGGRENRTKGAGTDGTRKFREPHKACRKKLTAAKKKQTICCKGAGGQKGGTVVV